MKTEPTQKRTRSFGSFSLRLLLILTTVCCVALAMWRVAIRPYQLQMEAAKAIEDLGGTVRMKPSRTWMTRVAGQEQFNDVIEVNLAGHNDASKYAKRLALLPRLETLRVGINFTDTDMQSLVNCKEIRRLFLSGTQVTDDGLQVCENFPYLRLLELGRNITDDGLAVLKGKQHLAYLGLTNTQVTDRGLEHLRGLPSLHKVCLNFRPVTDAGLDAIQSLPKLDELYMVGCIEVTDDGFSRLAKLYQLKQLDVSKTRIDDSTIALLEESLTRCRVLRDYRPDYY